MRPLTLSMEGFGAFHERVDIDVGDVDLLALVGPTGSGKSTIIDAITFALYGSVARYDDNRAVEPVINQTSTQARVQLDFELGGERYRATRVVRRTKKGATTPEARLERGAEVLADDARGMTTRVGELLGLDVEQFNKTVVLPQGRFAEFLHDKPADRQTTMRRLLDLGLYERMGKAARQRGNTARAQADGFGEDVAALAAALSDGRRAELVAATTAVSDAQRVVAAGLADVERADGELAVLEARRRDHGNALAALAAVVAPLGLTELEGDQRDVAADVAAATERLDAARDARRRAQDAAAAGPDLLTAQRQQDAHGRHRDQQAAHLDAVEAAAAARLRVEASAAAAATLTAQLDTLAGAARAASAAERAAADAVGAGPDEVVVGRTLDQHQRLAQAEAGLAALGDAVNTAERRAEAAESAAVRAAADADEERRRLDDARLRAGAAGLLAALRVGDDCPVCQQTVRSLPTDHGPAELAERQNALDRALAAAASARTAAMAARRQADAAGAEAAARHRAADELHRALAGAPPIAQLLAARDESARLRALATAARTEAARAETVLAASRADPATVAVLTRAAEDERGLQERTAAVVEHVRLLEAARAAVTGLPSPAAVAAAIDEAVALGKAKDRAEEEFGRAEADHGDAVRRRDAVAARATAARDALGTARDSVAALVPPVLDRTDVVAAWAELRSWAEATAAATIARRDADGARAAAVTTEREAALGAARRAVGAVLPAAGELATWRDRLVRAHAEAEAAIATFDADRSRLDALRGRVGGLRDEAAVADHLGRLLSATGFEAWLMEAALEELCDAATGRLLALSGGRYSLVVDDREFLVRDHHHADEMRSVRTLSGGETFLASLALALALAEATAELAPAGAPTIESIFLDEGFGTLDPETLDTVATAIEELGASGRMVAIVTHIRELADRMPVRLEVRRGATGSTVQRTDL